jgi:hypothetical protein
MTPNARARLERNMEYHDDLARHYKNILEPEDQNGEKVAKEETDNIQVLAEMQEAETLAQMHGDAAKMLRELLADTVEPVITEAMQNRPVIRRVN